MATINREVTKDEKRCYAILNRMKPDLETNGLSSDAVWDYVRSTNEVDSRTELTQKQWAITAARLSAAQQDNILFTNFCNEVRGEVHICRVYRYLQDGSRKKVYDGVVTDDIDARCQKHADATGCNVRLHGVDAPDSIKLFKPAEYADDPDTPPTIPIDPKKAARVFELHVKGKTTQYNEIAMPDVSDLAGWGQRHANECGHKVVITDRMGHHELMSFDAIPAQAPMPATRVDDVMVGDALWTLLNVFEDAEGTKYHFVKMDQSMERYIATADNRKAAIDMLFAHIQ